MTLPDLPDEFIKKLTQREVELYELTKAGYPQKFISASLNIPSRAYVARMKSRIVEKYEKWGIIKS